LDALARVATDETFSLGLTLAPSEIETAFGLFYVHARSVNDSLVVWQFQLDGPGLTRSWKLIFDVYSTKATIATLTSELDALLKELIDSRFEQDALR
jgi:hypothetical protein